MPISGAMDRQVVAACQPRQVGGPPVVQAEPLVRQVGTAEPGERQAGGRLAYPGEIEGEPGEAGGALVVQGRTWKSAAVCPHTVAASPLWKLTSVDHRAAGGVRSSRKNV